MRVNCFTAWCRTATIFGTPPFSAGHAIEEIKGIAVETVTEDAHTSLRMQIAGWNTAYINIPQAAGLATESLSSHFGQRIRWARGMCQILRTEESAHPPEAAISDSGSAISTPCFISCIRSRG